MTYLSPKNNPFGGNVADVPAKAWLGREPSEDPLRYINTSCYDDRDDDIPADSSEYDQGGPTAAARGIFNGFCITFAVGLFIVVAVVVLNGGAYNLINRSSAAHTGTQTAKTAEGGAR